MNPEILGWFIFFLSTALLFGSIFLPLYIWCVKKIYVSKVYKFARIIRIFFGAIIILVAAVMLFKTDSFNAEFFGATIGRLFVAYLLIKRWAPNQPLEK